MCEKMLIFVSYLYVGGIRASLGPREPAVRCHKKIILKYYEQRSNFRDQYRTRDEAVLH